MAGQHGDPAEPMLQMSTSSKSVYETAAASLVPCEWGRRAAAAPMLEWSAVKYRNVAQSIYTSFYTLTVCISQLMGPVYHSYGNF